MMQQFEHRVVLDDGSHAPVLEANTTQAFGDAFASIEKAVRQANNEIDTLRKRNQEQELKNKTLRQHTADLESQIRQVKSSEVVQQARSDATQVGQVESFSDAAAFMLERTVASHSSPAHSVDMHPTNTNLMASASWDATVRLQDAIPSFGADVKARTLGPETAEGSEKMGGLYAVAFAKTAPEVLGCTSCDHRVYLWNYTTGKRLHAMVGHTDEVNGIDFHTKQNVMCTASDDMKAIIWDFQEGITLRTLTKHTKAVYGTSFLGEANQYCVATCCFDQSARIFDMRDKNLVAELKTHEDDIIGIDYSSRDNVLATGSDDGIVAIWDAKTWTLRQSINTRQLVAENEVKRVKFSRDGKMLAAACSTGKVLVYNMSSTSSKIECLASLEGHTDCVFDVAWGVCPQTQRNILVSASHDHTSKVWRATM